MKIICGGKFLTELEDAIINSGDGTVFCFVIRTSNPLPGPRLINNRMGGEGGSIYGMRIHGTGENKSYEQKGSHAVNDGGVWLFAHA